MDSPLAWIGGKRLLRKQIVPLIPEDHSCYVEAFAGGSWVLFGKERSVVEVLNDKDGELMNFYQIAQKHPHEFSRTARDFLISRRLFEVMRNDSVEWLTEIERAVRFYYLLKLTFGARMKRPTFGIFTDRSPKWNPKRFEIEFKEISKRLERVIIECMEFATLILTYDRPWTLFYCDPPYLGAENLYAAQFEKEAHERLAGILKKIKGRFILTYNDHPDIWSLYEGCEFRQVKGNYSVSREADGRRSFGQLVISNFKPEVNHAQAT
jgi:DNA adenine methylase